VVDGKSVTSAFRAIAAAHAAGRDLVTVTVLSGDYAGYRYLSSTPTTIDGSIAPDIDARAAELAAHLWQARTPVLQDELFAEMHAVAEPLLIFGAGHIGVALANLAHTLGFQVTVLDDRTDFADAARFLDGVDVATLDFADPLAHITLTASTYIVLVTRAHKYDFDCLRAVLQQPAAPRYIGMIGSKRRVRAAFQALLASGIERARVETVHAPVGVEIGAETPAEIAVSIAAELIQVRRARPNTGKGATDRVLQRMFPQEAAQ
jgi:xanthine dehydrogenase accessory factor